jgi:diguanylate cyclase
MMNSILIDVSLGLIAMVIGAVGAFWISRHYFRNLAKTTVQHESHHASKVLVHLQELASKVAFDVDKHNDQVEEINESLTSVNNHEPKMIVDMVAKLIQANQQMHEKLATTENKLREQAQAIQASATEARTDALTLLVNRRAFDDELHRRCAEAARQGHVFSMIMADIDHFKDFNDTHGHVTGDEVLRAAAKMLRRKMREMDLVARYGGEEFAIILPGTVLSDAEKAALRACEGVEKSSFNHEGKDLHVTVSLGVAEIREKEDGISLVARADKALYAAKQDGRNCVYAHDGENLHRVAPAKPLIIQSTEAQRTKELAKSNGEEIAPETDEIISHDDYLDATSNMSSRSSFCQQVRSRTAEWRRGGPTFSIALIEVNQYKGGHSQRARENSVTIAAKYLANTVREMDIIGRYAPGCFALLLPTAELTNAIRLAERLREGFTHLDAAPEDENSRLTLSVGVVQIMDADDSITVLKRAEAALDAADRRGGDRAYCHDGERCAPITAMLETMDYLA